MERSFAPFGSGRGINDDDMFSALVCALSTDYVEDERAGIALLVSA